MHRRFRSVASLTGREQMTLAPRKYLEANGSLVEETLSRVIDDITSLVDIPEKESHRLNELLKFFNPVEDLFVADDGTVRPSCWLRLIALIRFWRSLVIRCFACAVVAEVLVPNRAIGMTKQSL